MYESYATWWEAVVDAVPDAIAIAQGPRQVTYRELDERAAGLAAALGELGVGPGEKIGLHLYNCPEYLEARFAAFKLRAVPVNVNYRYRAAELAYLLDNADAAVVISHASLAGELEPVIGAMAKLRAVVEVDDDIGTAAGPAAGTTTGARRYDDLVAAATPAPRIERSGDDVVIWYTGGTTGRPKGVVWHQGTLLDYAVTRGYVTQELEPPPSADGAGIGVAAIHARGTVQVQLTATPLIHATAVINTFQALSQGGRVVLTESRRLDPHELWRAVGHERVTHLTVVGDPVARPLVDALVEAEARGMPYDLSSLTRILSSGAIWSAPVKAALQARGSMVLYDTLGASEGIGLAVAEIRPGESCETSRFRLGPHAALLTDDGRLITTGAGEQGLLAVSGHVALGYYEDPERTTRVFRQIDGVHYAVPGDWATLAPDGTVTFLGRGSGCITTGGEKVWPEEVEETLKAHPTVYDSLVVGVADERFGETVVALVSGRPDTAVDADELRARAGERLAGYKVPRRIVVVDEVPRSPAGKADYTAARAAATR